MFVDDRSPDGETSGGPTGPPWLHNDDIAKIAQVVTELMKKNLISHGDESTSSSSTDRPRGRLGTRANLKGGSPLEPPQTCRPHYYLPSLFASQQLAIVLISYV